jgi:hypothetical protein
MIGLTWFHLRHGQNWLFFIIGNYLKISYFKVDEEIEWSSWMDGFNYDTKLMSPSIWKYEFHLHMIES